MSIYWSLMAQSKHDIFRKAVPEDLRAHFGKREIKVSLRQLAPEERPVRQLELHKHWEEQFEAARTGKTGRIFTPLAKAKPTSGDDNGLVLSELFSSWSRTKQNITLNSRLEWERSVRCFVELHGDLPIASITKAQLVAFRDALLRLPKHGSKQWQRLTLPQKLASLDAGSVKVADTISPKSVNKYLTALASLFEKAVKEGALSHNPAQGLKLDARHTRDDRLAFDEHDLQTIFSHDMFKSPEQDAVLYWAMYLGLYTGARLEEIGQLYLKDIKQQGEVWFLDINAAEDDKSLKTASSVRRVPLHYDLLAMGFITYVESLREQGEQRLFPQLQKDKRNKYTSTLSQRLNRLIDAAGIKDRRKSFHSMRHTFRDYAALFDVPEDRIEAMMGHANRKTSRSYGSGANLLKLNESLQQIRFPLNGETSDKKPTKRVQKLPERLEEYFAHLPRLTLEQVAEELAPALHLPIGVMLAMLQRWNTQLRTGEANPSVLCSPTAFTEKDEVIIALKELGYWI